MMAAIAAWFGGPFTAFVKGIPRGVWIAVLAVMGIWVLREDAKRDGRREGREDAEEDFNKRIKEANAETADRVERARQAGDEIEKDLFDDSDRTRELNLEQLRKLTDDDPNNRRGRVRDA